MDKEQLEDVQDIKNVDHYDKFFWQPGDVTIYTPEDAIPLDQVPYMVDEGDEDGEDEDWPEEDGPIRTRAQIEAEADED